MEQQQEISLGRLTERQSAYGTFYTGYLRLEELQKIVDDKGFCKIVISKLKTPDKFGNNFNIKQNKFKKAEVNTSKAKNEFGDDLITPF